MAGYFVGWNMEFWGGPLRLSSQKPSMRKRWGHLHVQKDDSHEKMILDSYPQSQNSQKPSPKASPNFHRKVIPPKRILKTQQQPEGQPRKHKPLTRLDGPPAEERKLRRNQWERWGGCGNGWEKYMFKKKQDDVFVWAVNALGGQTWDFWWELHYPMVWWDGDIADLQKRYSDFECFGQ